MEFFQQFGVILFGAAGIAVACVVVFLVKQLARIARENHQPAQHRAAVLEDEGE
jgi:hypothetical protein